MTPKDIEQILRLMNKYGCTKLSTSNAIFEVPSPAKPLVDDLLNVTDEEMSKVEKQKEIIDQYQKFSKEISKSQDDIDDEILFYHEEVDGDV